LSLYSLVAYPDLSRFLIYRTLQSISTTFSVFELL